MKHLFRLVLRLYPREWRARYGDEFTALLDQLPGRFGDLVDICWGAIKMRWKLANIPELLFYGALAFSLVWGCTQSIGSHVIARLSEVLFTTFGVLVLREGDVLSLARHQLFVRGFSGGSWTLPALALIATGHLTFVERRFASRFVYLLGLIPVTVIASSVRVVVAGALTEVFDSDWAIIAGWLSFLICATVLLRLCRRFVGVMRWHHEPGH